MSTLTQANLLGVGPFRFDNVIRTKVTTILMPSWATRVAIEKVWGRCFSSRSPSNLGGVDVNPFASSYLVDRLKWVDSLVGLKSVFILHVYRTLHGSPNTVPWGHRTRLSHRARIRGQIDFYLMDSEGLWIWIHKISHSESSGNHAVKIYAQYMNYRIYAKILNSLST